VLQKKDVVIWYQNVLEKDVKNNSKNVTGEDQKDVNHFHTNANYKDIKIKNSKLNVVKNLKYVKEKNVNQKMYGVNGKDYHIIIKIKKLVKCSQSNHINF